MLLHTPWCANHIADPQSVLTLDRFVGEEGMEAVDPLSLAEFVKYGLCYQQQLVPDLDERRVTRIERASCGFRITLEDGAPIQTQRVVIATGYCFFARRPPQFDHLPQTVASHTFDHNDLGKFAGQRVLVVGGGQSGFGSAALLDAAGAQVEVVLRKRRLSWLGESKGTKQVSLVKRCYRHIAHLRAIRPLLFPRTGVGPPPMSWITNLPGLLRHLPHASRHWINNWIDQRIIDRGSSWWPDRLGNVPITTGRAVRSTSRVGTHSASRWMMGMTREVDHMLLATGYVVDITGHHFSH
jgi:hypothetical protein